MRKQVVTWYRSKRKELRDLTDRPHAIAVGIAVGIFFGFTPLWGLKTLLTLGVTKLFKGNLVAAVLGVTAHDLILPLMPFLLRWQYQLGYWLLSHPHHWPPALRTHLHLRERSTESWWHWSSFFHTGLPLLVGSVIFAAPCAVLSYYLSIALVNRSRRKKALLAAEAATAETEVKKAGGDSDTTT